MTKGLDLRNHFSLTSSVLVNQICQDILKGIGITYFNYIKVFNDGSRELLTSNGDWIDHFYKNELYKTTAVVDVEYLIPKGYILWSELNVNEAAYSQGRESYNIDNGITLISKTVDSTSLFIFASTRNNDRINCFYQRNIDLLKRFILYFTDKGHDLLQVAAKNRIYLPDRQLIDEQRKSQLIISEEVRRDFFSQTSIDRFYISGNERNIYLTKREAECAALIVSGDTAKQVAKRLGISFRTVESHINQVKGKLDCSSKDDLIKFFSEANIENAII